MGFTEPPPQTTLGAKGLDQGGLKLLVNIFVLYKMFKEAIFFNFFQLCNQLGMRKR